MSHARNRGRPRHAPDRDRVLPGKCPWTLADRPDVSSLVPRIGAIVAGTGTAMSRPDRHGRPAAGLIVGSTCRGRPEFHAAQGES